MIALVLRFYFATIYCDRAMVDLYGVADAMSYPEEHGACIVALLENRNPWTEEE